ncbi:hypothetical protein AVEN_44888-1 [Araneus ventricosus]|uniref:Uncharacterized protein n=1 Tax=Araneus ventricosus TaxID=182803 RepID=A0A4Y2L4N7_ARAVE|nr:hypothetical protein AVEN_44888-1 [Araneus ventricosus]
MAWNGPTMDVQLNSLEISCWSTIRVDALCIKPRIHLRAEHISNCPRTAREQLWTVFAANRFLSVSSTNSDGFAVLTGTCSSVVRRSPQTFKVKSTNKGVFCFYAC